MNRTKIEEYTVYSILILPAVLFIFIPAHPTGSFDLALNRFIDDYLLGNGYYLPSDYPFAAKVINNFSVVLAVISGAFMGFWRRNDLVIPLPKNIRKANLIILCLGLWAFWLSLHQQEFSTLKGRNFMATESFHNTPHLFLALLSSKTICIYAGLRVPITFSLYFLRKTNIKRK
ncbi:hypothetical protein V6667_00790 [Neisseria leonii]|uniref:Uncharacterized protein n=1 Tax=Neisseria leonii TaxID=2995413 RepID=A0A9X4E7Q3_9NEIS|nr:hypothetical protein [Neisseria sp. 51.81]MDD9328577.1 hypothetical protein [Neisseria sp. 51.81]